MTLRSLSILGLALVLVGCANAPQQPTEAHVIYKRAYTESPHCVETGAVLHYPAGEPIPKALFAKADIRLFSGAAIAIAFFTSVCDGTQDITFTQKEEDIPLAEFQFHYDHDKAFRDSIASYSFR